MEASSIARFSQRLEQRNVVFHCPNAYVGQTGRQFSTRVKDHKAAVRRHDEHSLLALHCLPTGHTFNCLENVRHRKRDH